MTIDFWPYLIIMILTGAWTGYITNDVAIKMLFKEYGFGPFKFGGVIVKTRKDLEKNLATLVEKEIINHNTLKNQFHKPEVKQAISNTVVSFFNDSIYSNTKDVRLSDVPGFNETIDQSLSFLREYLSTHLGEFFTDLSKEVDLSDILSNEQAFTISERLAKELVSLIQKEQVLAPLMEDLFKHYKKMTVEDLLGKEIVSIVAHNIGELLNTIFEEMRYKHDKDISTFISKLYRDLDIETLVGKLESYLGDKPISYYINEETLDKVYRILRDYLKESESKDSIEVFCEGLMVALKKIDKPIIDLFTGDIRLEVEKFLETQLPGIIDRLIEIVQRNSHEIEELIESSIDQTIYDQQAIKRIILQAIRIFLIENFTQKYDIINKIVELLKGIDIENLSKTISEQVVDILHQKSVSSIIVELESNSILTSRLIASQVHRVLSFLLERYLSSDIDHTDFLNRPLGEVIHLNIKPFVNNLTVSVLTKQILYNQDLLNVIKEAMRGKIIDLSRVQLTDLVSESRLGQFSNYLENSMADLIVKRETEITDYLFHRMVEFLEENQLSTILGNEHVNYKNDAIVELMIQSIQNVVKDKGTIQIHEIFSQVTSIDSLSDNVVNTIMDFLDNGLSKVLEGNVSRVVENNIKKLSNDEILDLMQDFMGKKLGPLTTIGAILGAAVGSIMAYANIDAPGIFQWSSVIYSIPVYAFLGYITNVAAIFFIFRPYKPLFGIKSFQGIIPRQIPVLGDSLGKIVSEDLLSQESIDFMMQKDETKLKQSIKMNVQKDKYQMLRSYMTDHTPKMASEVNDTVFKQVKNNNGFLAVKFASDVMKLDLNKIKTEVFVEILAKVVTERVNLSQDSFSKMIMNQFKSSKKLSELSEDFSTDKAEEIVSQWIRQGLSQAIKRFNDREFLIKVLYKNQEKIDHVIDRSLADVIPEKTKISIQNFLYQLVSNYLFASDKQRSLSNYVFTELSTILHNNDSIDEMFGGRFFELINFNMTTILERIEDVVVSWLNAHKDEINDSVTDRVYEELSVMQQVGYKAVNGDKLVRDTVYRMVDEKLPDFVRRKMDNLNAEFKIFFENLGKIKLKEANIELQKEELQNYLTNVFASKEIEVKTRRFIEGVMDHFLNFNTGQVFEIVSIKGTHDIVTRYKDIFILVNEGILDSLKFRQEKVAEDLSLIVNRFITREIFQNRVRNLTLGITEDQVNEIVGNLIRVLNKDEVLYNNIYNIAELMVNHMKHVPIDQILDEFYLSQDLKKFIAKMSIDRKVQSITKKQIEHLFQMITDQFDVLVHDELKEEVLNDLINAAYDVLMKHLSEILAAVDFKEVTVREINGMDAKQIKLLFDRIAKKYFFKLEIYGFYGGIFAVEVITFVSFVFYLGQKALVNKSEKGNH